MPPGGKPFEVCTARTSGSRPWGRPRIRMRDCISRLGRERLGIPHEELESFAIDGWMDANEAQKIFNMR